MADYFADGFEEDVLEGSQEPDEGTGVVDGAAAPVGEVKAVKRSRPSRKSSSVALSREQLRAARSLFDRLASGGSLSGVAVALCGSGDVVDQAVEVQSAKFVAAVDLLKRVAGLSDELERMGLLVEAELSEKGSVGQVWSIVQVLDGGDSRLDSVRSDWRSRAMAVCRVVDACGVESL